MGGRIRKFSRRLAIGDICTKAGIYSLKAVAVVVPLYDLVSEENPDTGFFILAAEGLAIWKAAEWLDDYQRKTAEFRHSITKNRKYLG